MSASAVPHSGVAARRPFGKHRHDGDPLASSAVLVALVHARGPLDAARVRPFVDELDGSIDAGATSLLVDLSLVDEVTTAGLNGLLAARQRMLAAGGRIAVVLPPRLRRRFQALDLERRFELASSRLHAARLLGLVGEDEAGPNGRARGPVGRHARAA